LPACGDPWENAAVHAIAVGFGLGFFVALQLGPMSLLLIRSTLRGGWAVGLAIGAGIALVDALYAAAGAAGAAPLLTFEPVRIVLGLVGAAVLVVLGVRTLWSAFRVRHGGEADAEVATPRRAFVTALGGTASNPSTIASWAAIFAAASAAGAADTAAGAVLLVVGVGIGSLTWVTLLASGTAVARRAAGERTMRIADSLAGAGLIGFGGALAYGVTREP
jgi:putative LysE/RhtB family amino acid efflux pump